jgi:hypothetical protein
MNYLLQICFASAVFYPQAAGYQNHQKGEAETNLP